MASFLRLLPLVRRVSTPGIYRQRLARPLLQAQFRFLSQNQDDDNDDDEEPDFEDMEEFDEEEDGEYEYSGEEDEHDENMDFNEDVDEHAQALDAFLEEYGHIQNREQYHEALGLEEDYGRESFAVEGLDDQQEEDQEEDDENKDPSEIDIPSYSEFKQLKMNKICKELGINPEYYVETFDNEFDYFMFSKPPTTTVFDNQDTTSNTPEAVIRQSAQRAAMNVFRDKKIRKIAGHTLREKVSPSRAIMRRAMNRVHNNDILGGLKTMKFGTSKLHKPLNMPQNYYLFFFKQCMKASNNHFEHTAQFVEKLGVLLFGKDQRKWLALSASLDMQFLTAAESVYQAHKDLSREELLELAYEKAKSTKIQNETKRKKSPLGLDNDPSLVTMDMIDGNSYYFRKDMMKIAEAQAAMPDSPLPTIDATVALATMGEFRTVPHNHQLFRYLFDHLPEHDLEAISLMCRVYLDNEQDDLLQFFALEMLEAGKLTEQQYAELVREHFRFMAKRKALPRSDIETGFELLARAAPRQLKAEDFNIYLQTCVNDNGTADVQKAEKIIQELLFSQIPVNETTLYNFAWALLAESVDKDMSGILAPLYPLLKALGDGSTHFEVQNIDIAIGLLRKFEEVLPEQGDMKNFKHNLISAIAVRLENGLKEEVEPVGHMDMEMANSRHRILTILSEIAKSDYPNRYMLIQNLCSQNGWQASKAYLDSHPNVNLTPMSYMCLFEGAREPATMRKLLQRFSKETSFSPRTRVTLLVQAANHSTALAFSPSNSPKTDSETFPRDFANIVNDILAGKFGDASFSKRELTHLSLMARGAGGDVEKAVEAALKTEGTDVEVTEEVIDRLLLACTRHHKLSLAMTILSKIHKFTPSTETHYELLRTLPPTDLKYFERIYRRQGPINRYLPKNATPKMLKEMPPFSKLHAIPIPTGEHAITREDIKYHYDIQLQRLKEELEVPKGDEAKGFYKEPYFIKEYKERLAKRSESMPTKST